MIKWISTIYANDVNEILNSLRYQGDGQQNEINIQVADELILKLNKCFSRPEVDAKTDRSPVLEKKESTAFVDYADGRGETLNEVSQHWVCPVCKCIVDYRIDTPVNADPVLCNFCPACGQKIDWTFMGHDEIVNSIIRTEAEKMLAEGTE